MGSNNNKKESEDLAERLRSLYQMHHCENDLPNLKDLVAKLESVETEVCEATKMELDRGCIYPISEKEAKIPLTKRFKTLYALTLFEGVRYAEEKHDEKNLKKDGWGVLLRAIYGGIRAFPSTAKATFLEQDSQQIIEEHNRNAALIFKCFKNNLDYFLKT